MALDVDQEILQDFLVEAGEILEQLSEQLVELELRPNDADLLNAIFRGFHTVKGGAGFLSLTSMVDICHVSENVFDILRNGQREVNADLMDVVLKALDAVNNMFDEVRSNEEPTAANKSLLQQLEVLAQPAAEAAVASTGVDEDAEQAASEAQGATAQQTVVETESTASEGPEQEADQEEQEEITEDEFERLLDHLHGAGGAPGQGSAAVEELQQQCAQQLPTESSQPSATEAEVSSTQEADIAAKVTSNLCDNANDEISEEEFENLLDSLHGDGAAPGSAPATGIASPAKQTELESAAKLQQENTTEKAAIEKAAAEKATPKDQKDSQEQSLAERLQATSKPVAKEPQEKQDNSAAVKTSNPLFQKPKTEKPPVAAAKKKPVDTATVASASETTVRVDTSRLDDIMNMVGELVLVRNRLVTLGASMHDENMVQAVANLDVVTADLQMAVMKTRMQPIKKVFGRFPRVVRDLARSLKKDIVLEMVGEETDLDKNLVEALADPLVHLVRNSVDHGIEMPEVREQSGKSRTGTVVLSAEQAGDHILLSIKDDGAGMDPDKLRSIVVSKGLMDKDAADRLSEKECFNLIFMPGFSTKEQISDISGRGVGMDVVKTKITQLNGSVDIDSVMGQGTCLSIKVPLTLAILPTLMVELGNQTFALPLTSVNEIFHLDLTNTNIVDGQLTVIVRDKALPLFYLKNWLVENVDSEKHPKAGHVVIVSVGTQRIGFVVDQLVGQEEVVIKPLGSMLHGTPGMAGATITGDGNIAMILDIPSLLKHYARRV